MGGTICGKFDIQVAFENHAQAKLTVLKTAAITGQPVPTQVYSLGPIFKRARGYRTEFESGLSQFTSTSEGHLAINAEKVDEFRAYLTSKKDIGNQLLEAIPEKSKDDRAIVKMQLMQIESLLGYLSQAN